MELEEALKQLAHNPAYANVVAQIHAYRENSIKALAGAPTETVQQISGELLAYDSILDLMNWELINNIHFNKIN